MNDQNNRLRKESGEIDSDDKLVNFLYTLMRDYISIGIVEKLTCDAENEKGMNQYSNGWLAQYAKYVADILSNKE